MSPITDEHGVIVGAAVFTRDIGVRVLAQERMRRSEMLLAEAEELAGLGSWEWDIATNDVFWSAGLFRILGLDPDEVAPSYEGYVERFHPDDRKLAEDQMAEAIATGSVVLQHTRMLGDDGVERITQSRARITRDADGIPVRLRGTTQDVSQIVRATHRLDVANRRNQALLNSAGEGIYGIDRNGTTTFANPVAARLIGYDVEELVGRSRHDTFRHTRSDGTRYRVSQCPVSASLLDGTVHRCDSDLYWRRDGTSFPVEYTSTPILEDAHVVGAVVVFKDISKRRETERRKDDFIASVSHELRTPLTSILGYLELIGDDDDRRPDRQAAPLPATSSTATPTACCASSATCCSSRSSTPRARSIWSSRTSTSRRSSPMPSRSPARRRRPRAWRSRRRSRRCPRCAATVRDSDRSSTTCSPTP